MQRIKEKESCHLRPDILEASERSRLRQSLGVIGEESPCDAGDPGSIPGSGGCPGGGNGNPVFLPGRFHGQRSMAGSSPCDCRVEHD